jgi:hypothetical protein
MKNGMSREEFSSTEISKVLACYRQSGLGAVRFAQEQGIPPGRLHYWIYQKGRTSPRRPRRDLVSKPVFQEIKVETDRPGMESWAAEVNLPSGLAVRFGLKARAEWIGSVVQALRGLC